MIVPLLVVLVVVRMATFTAESAECTNGPVFGLVDFDANLLHPDLKAHAQEHMERAKGVGVTHFVVPGSTLADSEASITLSQARGTSAGAGAGAGRSDVIATAGVHPYHVNEVPCGTDSLNILRALCASDHCHAVGECGLDYSEGFPPKEEQQAWFVSQLALAREVEKPLFLHERDAHSDFLAALDSVGLGGLTTTAAASSAAAAAAAAAAPAAVAAAVAQAQAQAQAQAPVVTVPCIVHCFTGTTAELRAYVDRGFYIGLTGFVMHRLEPGVLQEWVRAIPEDRLLIETDAPYMGFKGCRKTEVSKRGSRYPNVPAALPQVLQAVATAAGVSERQLAASTIRNARRLFPRVRW